MRRQESSGSGVAGLRPARRRAFRVVTLVVLLAAPWAAGVTRAEAAIRAPSYEAGPEVVSGGLLWSDFSLGQPNVLLSTASGTRLLVQNARLSAVAVNDGWMLVARPSGPEVGRIGGPLAPVRRLRSCPPVQIGEQVPTPAGTAAVGSHEREPAVISDEPEDRLDTVANGDLYAVVRASCIDHGLEHARLLVRVRLRSGALHVIGPVPPGAISLAASGSRIALTYETGVERGVRVEVLDAHSARLLYRLSPPVGERGRFYKETQIDAKGDVLVTSGSFRPPGVSSYGWWAGAGTRVGHPLPTGERIAATLAAGRIAYVPASEDESEDIELLDLKTHITRTIVTFSGSATIEGLGLDSTAVAWAQLRYSYALNRDGENSSGPHFCVGYAQTGPTELTDTPLDPPGPPISLSASPGPRPAGLPCVVE
jgi:hypothetical protein